MQRRPHRSTRTDTPLPYQTLFRSPDTTSRSPARATRGSTCPALPDPACGGGNPLPAAALSGTMDLNAPMLVHCIDFDLVSRLGAAVVLGLLLGLDRELRGHAAGLRTHGLICFSAARDDEIDRSRCQRLGTHDHSLHARSANLVD